MEEENNSNMSFDPRQLSVTTTTTMTHEGSIDSWRRSEYYKEEEEEVPLLEDGSLLDQLFFGESNVPISSSSNVVTKSTRTTIGSYHPHHLKNVNPIQVISKENIIVPRKNTATVLRLDTTTPIRQQPIVQQHQEDRSDQTSVSAMTDATTPTMTKTTTTTNLYNDKVVDELPWDRYSQCQDFDGEDPLVIFNQRWKWGDANNNNDKNDLLEPLSETRTVDQVRIDLTDFVDDSNDDNLNGSNGDCPPPPPPPPAAAAAAATTVIGTPIASRKLTDKQHNDLVGGLYVNQKDTKPPHHDVHGVKSLNKNLLPLKSSFSSKIRTDMAAIAVDTAEEVSSVIPEVSNATPLAGNVPHGRKMDPPVPSVIKDKCQSQGNDHQDHQRHHHHQTIIDLMDLDDDDDDDDDTHGTGKDYHTRDQVRRVGTIIDLTGLDDDDDDNDDDTHRTGKDYHTRDKVRKVGCKEQNTSTTTPTTTRRKSLIATKTTATTITNGRNEPSNNRSNNKGTNGIQKNLPKCVDKKNTSNEPTHTGLGTGATTSTKKGWQGNYRRVIFPEILYDLLDYASSSTSTSTSSSLPVSDTAQVVGYQETGVLSSSSPSSTMPASKQTSVVQDIPSHRKESSPASQRFGISWCEPDGKAFMITDRKRLQDTLLSKFFPDQSLYRSFERNLNGWGFQRNHVPMSKGVHHVNGKRPSSSVDYYSHPFFVRGHREECHLKMRRQVCNPLKHAKLRLGTETNANKDINKVVEVDDKEMDVQNVKNLTSPSTKTLKRPSSSPVVAAAAAVTERTFEKVQAFFHPNEDVDPCRVEGVEEQDHHDNETRTGLNTGETDTKKGRQGTCRRAIFPEILYDLLDYASSSTSKSTTSIPLPVSDTDKVMGHQETVASVKPSFSSSTRPASKQTSVLQDIPSHQKESLSASKRFGISWCEPDGKAFVITDQKRLQDTVLSKFFPNQSLYRSFERNLNMWGFQRNDVPIVRTYSHPFFVRGHRDECRTKIHRQRQGQKSTRIRDKFTSISIPTQPAKLQLGTDTNIIKYINKDVDDARAVDVQHVQNLTSSSTKTLNCPSSSPVVVPAAAAAAAAKEPTFENVQKIFHPNENVDHCGAKEGGEEDNHHNNETRTGLCTGATDTKGRQGRNWGEIFPEILYDLLDYASSSTTTSISSIPLPVSDTDKIIGHQKTGEPLSSSSSSSTSSTRPAAKQASVVQDIPTIRKESLSASKRFGISWCEPDGKAFVITDRKRLQDTLLSKFFPNQTIYYSFQRSLKLWGFQQIVPVSKGVNHVKGKWYFHPFFVRGHREECHLKMRRQNVKNLTSPSTKTLNRPSSSPVVAAAAAAAATETTFEKVQEFFHHNENVDHCRVEEEEEDEDHHVNETRTGLCTDATNTKTGRQGKNRGVIFPEILYDLLDYASSSTATSTSSIPLPVSDTDKIMGHQKTGKPSSSSSSSSTRPSSKQASVVQDIPNHRKESLSASKRFGISWCEPDGKGFVITNRKRLQDTVLSKFFPNQTLYRSFERNLNIWGFQRNNVPMSTVVNHVLHQQQHQQQQQGGGGQDDDDDDEECCAPTSSVHYYSHPFFVRGHRDECRMKMQRQHQKFTRIKDKSTGISIPIQHVNLWLGTETKNNKDVDVDDKEEAKDIQHVQDPTNSSATKKLNRSLSSSVVGIATATTTAAKETIFEKVQKIFHPNETIDHHCRVDDEVAAAEEEEKDGDHYHDNNEEEIQKSSSEEEESSSTTTGCSSSNLLPDAGGGGGLNALAARRRVNDSSVGYHPTVAVPNHHHGSGRIILHPSGVAAITTSVPATAAAVSAGMAAWNTRKRKITTSPIVSSSMVQADENHQVVPYQHGTVYHHPSHQEVTPWEQGRQGEVAQSSSPWSFHKRRRRLLRSSSDIRLGHGCHRSWRSPFHHNQLSDGLGMTFEEEDEYDDMNWM